MKNGSFLRLVPALAVSLLASLAAGCSSDPVFVRGSEVEGLDDPPMSTGIDKRDMEQLLHENMKHLLASPLAKTWADAGDDPTLAIFPMLNETSQHIDSQLQAVLSDAETFMVNSQLVTVVSRERQNQMIAEVERQHGGQFDPNHAAQYGRQLGAKYYMTGKVYTSDERTAGGRRVQYFMFMQVIETETSAVRWQNKAAFTKALINQD
ncbi:penicillin-binding protein activator LpoB [Polyangium sp. 6x1]|uniref:penicillin-binding protein activator LpoB n=1 Tax=Polyangium sp. 6x1 TaxID=3042689 RepID=UPI00248301A5|nr:penicillin-binding protein activator LpoB [Polyangium sp. 6x1]MDI1443285.1 penicillin-binding protein activator LpoB [Polyangium sp. 6x1]